MRRVSGWKTKLLSGVLLFCSGWLSVSLPAAAQPRSLGQAAGASADAPTNPVDYERLPFMKQSPAESSSEAPSAGGLLLRTFGALFLVLGLLVAGAWGLRRFGSGRLAQAGNTEVELSVVATLPLGERRSVSAVRFGDQVLLLGATAQTVTLLAKTALPLEPILPATPRMRSVAELLAEDEPAEAVPANFERALLLAKEQYEPRPNWESTPE